MLIPTNNLVCFPVKDKKWLTDSKGKVRVYKTVKRAVVENKDREYDHIQVFMLDDVLSREECETLVFGVKCKDCKYLMFSDCYGECSKAYKGIVQPNDSCGKGKLRKVGGKE